MAADCVLLVADNSPMPKFAANLSTLFTEWPFLDRFERAARAGFDAVEFQLPYAHPADEIRARLDAHGLRAVLFNTPAGDYEHGERGLACVPARSEEFRAGIGTAVRYAQALGVSQLHCMAGRAPPRVGAAAARKAYVENLRFAADALGRIGARVLIEPINVIDVPGYFLNRTAQAVGLLDDIGAENVFVQYDLYHAQRSEGELAATLSEHLANIGHVQLADNPGRHEPGTGEINFPFLFDLLDAIGYAGWVGCEYQPLRGTEEGLGWWDDVRARRSATTRR